MITMVIGNPTRWLTNDPRNAPMCSDKRVLTDRERTTVTPEPIAIHTANIEPETVLSSKVNIPRIEKRSPLAMFFQKLVSAYQIFRIYQQSMM